MAVFKFTNVWSVKAEDEVEAQEILSDYLDQVRAWEGVIENSDVTQIPDDDPWATYALTREDI